MLRRLLIFADSRQDTAFQAGYLRDRARSLRIRLLITGIVTARSAAGLPPASFNSLVEEVFRQGRGAGLYEDPAGADARARALRVCEWDLLGEIASDERRPPTLERLGLITTGYPGIEQLTTEDLAPLLEHVGPDETAARWLLARICDLARTRRGVAHPLLRTRLEPKTEAELTDAGATVRIGAPVTGLGDTLVKPAGTQAISMGHRGAVAAMARKVFPNLTGADPVERAVPRRRRAAGPPQHPRRRHRRDRAAVRAAAAGRPAGHRGPPGVAGPAPLPGLPGRPALPLPGEPVRHVQLQGDHEPLERRPGRSRAAAGHHPGAGCHPARRALRPDPPGNAGGDRGPVQGRRPERPGLHHDPGTRRRPGPAAVGHLAQRPAPAQQLRPARRPCRPPRGARRPHRHLRRKRPPARRLLLRPPGGDDPRRNPPARVPPRQRAGHHPPRTSPRPRTVR